MKFNWSMIWPGAAPQNATCAGLPAIVSEQSLAVSRSDNKNGVELAGTPSRTAPFFGPKPFPHRVHTAPGVTEPPAQLTMATPFTVKAEGAMAANVTASLLVAKPYRVIWTLEGPTGVVHGTWKLICCGETYVNGAGVPFTRT